MCGTSPTALSAYSKYKPRNAAVEAFARGVGATAGRGIDAVDVDAVDIDGDGQKLQQIAVSSSAIAPRPIQVSTSPHRISSGISVPEAAMPIPTPVKIAPPAMPRRLAGIAASTVGAASTISTPPVPPDRNRQAKNHAKLTGAAQANRLAQVSSIAFRKVVTAPKRVARTRAPSAPAR